MFMAHLYWKFSVPSGFDRLWAGFDFADYPFFARYYTLSAEILGALLLIPGIATRWVCLYTAPLMLGGVLTWMDKNGLRLTASSGGVPSLWFVMLMVQALLGNGPYAVRRATDAEEEDIGPITLA